LLSRSLLADINARGSESASMNPTKTNATQWYPIHAKGGDVRALDDTHLPIHPERKSLAQCYRRALAKPLESWLLSLERCDDIQLGDRPTEVFFDQGVFRFHRRLRNEVQLNLEEPPDHSNI
jgi:hypothetical protein